MIPEFENTDEALAFGKIATEAQKELLARRRMRYIKISKGCSDLDKAMGFAVKAQFDREAMEVHNGRIL